MGFLEEVYLGSCGLAEGSELARGVDSGSGREQPSRPPPRRPWLSRDLRAQLAELTGPGPCCRTGTCSCLTRWSSSARGGATAMS